MRKIRERFEKAGGRFIRGTATLTGPRTVRVGDQEFEAATAIVLNTGTPPAVPPIPGLAGTPFWTNREAVTVTEAPSSLIVLGGGPIGLEMAQVFARFGTHVQVLEALDRLLPLEEPESGRLFADVLSSEGLSTLHSEVIIDTIVLPAGEGPRAPEPVDAGELV